MEKLQSVIIEIRQNRAANKIDKSQALNAEIGAEGEYLKFLETNHATIERMGNVLLTLTSSRSPLKLNVPVDRPRLLKENTELEKVIANSDRQLANAEIIGKMPEKVVETLRAKNVAYRAQLQKNLDALRSE
jgi:valyl-tRNA synthetase